MKKRRNDLLSYYCICTRDKDVMCVTFLYQMKGAMERVSYWSNAWAGRIGLIGVTEAESG